jgi:hypothetical protein
VNYEGDIRFFYTDFHRVHEEVIRCQPTSHQIDGNETLARHEHRSRRHKCRNVGYKRRNVGHDNYPVRGKHRSCR